MIKSDKRNIISLPPQLALVIVLIFISFIIYNEHRRCENISGAVWIIAFWILYSSSKGLGFFLNIQTTMEAGSAPDRYLQLSLATLSLIIIFKRNFPFASVLKKNIPAIMVIFYSLISAIWSMNSGLTFRRWGREAIALLIALLLISEKYPIQTLKSALKKAIYAALPLSILLIKYYPAYGRSYGRWSGELIWEGIAGQKNGLAMICTISILFLIWSNIQVFNNWRSINFKLPIFIDIFILFLAIYLMMGPQRTFSYSATSFLALIFGLICLISFRIAIKYRIKFKFILFILALIIIFIGIYMPFSGKIPIKSLPQLLNRSETLTERTIIWESLIPYARQHLFFGYGFGGFWNTELRKQIASHAHNGYLDAILELGIFGLLLFIIYIFLSIKKSWEFLIIGTDISYFFLSLIFIIILRSITESPLAEFSNYYMWLLLSWSFILGEKCDIIIRTDEKPHVQFS